MKKDELQENSGTKYLRLNVYWCEFEGVYDEK